MWVGSLSLDVEDPMSEKTGTVGTGKNDYSLTVLVGLFAFIIILGLFIWNNALDSARASLSVALAASDAQMVETRKQLDDTAAANKKLEANLKFADELRQKSFDADETAIGFIGALPGKLPSIVAGVMGKLCTPGGFWENSRPGAVVKEEVGGKLQLAALKLVFVTPERVRWAAALSRPFVVQCMTDHDKATLRELEPLLRADFKPFSEGAEATTVHEMLGLPEGEKVPYSAGELARFLNRRYAEGGLLLVQEYQRIGLDHLAAISTASSWWPPFLSSGR